MRIGGLQKFSLIDYPGKTSAVIFTQGCNYRCPFCHNPELVLPEFYGEPIALDEIFEFLESRTGKLDAVVISGGEPTVQLGLSTFLKLIKRLGYSIKLDTNGSRPEVLRQILQGRLVDFIAMDIKAPFEKYALLTGGHGDVASIQRSIRLIENAGIAYQFRTTFSEHFLDNDDIERIKEGLCDARKYCLQEYAERKDKILDKIVQ